MTVRIESVDRLSVGDEVSHEGADHVVTETVVWSDPWGDYAHTEAALEPVGGDSEPSEG